MIWLLEHLVQSAGSCSKEVNGRWVPARPYPAPWIVRVKAAWLVYRGRADAVIWPEGQ